MSGGFYDKGIESVSVYDVDEVAEDDDGEEVYIEWEKSTAYEEWKELGIKDGYAEGKISEGLLFTRIRYEPNDYGNGYSLTLTDENGEEDVENWLRYRLEEFACGEYKCYCQEELLKDIAIFVPDYLIDMGKEENIKKLVKYFKGIVKQKDFIKEKNVWSYQSYDYIYGHKLKKESIKYIIEKLIEKEKKQFLKNCKEYNKDKFYPLWHYTFYKNKKTA